MLFLGFCDITLNLKFERANRKDKKKRSKMLQ